METHKRSKYLEAYHDQGIAFAPLVCNSLGQLGPDFLRFLWSLANHAARNQVPLELIALPQLGLDEPSPTQVAFQRLRCAIYTQSCYRVLAAIFEGVTERVYGRTFALRTLTEYNRAKDHRFHPLLRGQEASSTATRDSFPLLPSLPSSWSRRPRLFRFTFELFAPSLPAPSDPALS